MEYYHNQVTTQSWELLKTLRNQLSFILIGGWATYLYTPQLPELTLSTHRFAAVKKRLKTAFA